MKLAHYRCLFVFTLLLPVVCQVATAAPMDIVPGKSVGKVMLGITLDEARGLLGEPTDVDEGLLSYVSKTTGNVLILGGSKVVEVILFSSPEFNADGGLNTQNAMSLAADAGYRKWAKKGAEYVGWVHPEGGLVFFLEGPAGNKPVFGMVFKRELSLSQVLSDDSLYAVNDTAASESAPNSNAVATWEGSYNYEYTNELNSMLFAYFDLTINCVGNTPCAKLKIQRSYGVSNFICSVEETGNSVAIRFIELAPDNDSPDVPEPGVTFFVLHRQPDDIITTEWKEIDTDSVSGICFTKTDTDAASSDVDTIPGRATEIPDNKPADGMLVFKGLFVGMHLLQAAQVLDEAMEFSYSVEEQEESMYNPQEKDYTIQAAVGERTIKVTQIRHNTKENNIFRPIFNPVDPQIDERIESHFKSLGNMQQAVQKVVDELNAGLGNWQLNLKDGSPFISMRNLFAVGASVDGQVNYISLEPPLTVCWFNVLDMSGSDFAQQFIDSYGIPSLEGKVDIVDPADEGLFGAYFKSMGVVESKAVTTWEYTSPAGYKLSMTDEKKIVVEAVASASQRRFD
jgi:hypothetical protein